MKLILEINNQASCNFDEKKLRLAIEKTILNSGIKKISSKKITISLGFISSKKIREINKKYRRKDSPTDILSFANYVNQNDIIKEKSEEIFFGDLLICCEDIEDYIKKEKISFEEELIRVISHGTLHLLGFAHGDKMFEIQEKIVKENKI